ncbi:hypothetical protein BKA70DRAFT_1298868 [Coprinopsis sp. MPI-PUGE-AT-0042]|nr:hypothetical protein BKA70DRAFT_1298868 [Coprinopsis sp. MPI-PUGE-AT-0042]
MEYKRNRSLSPGQSVATKKPRWEVDVAAPPSECVPTVSGSALISGVHSLRIDGGTFSVAGPGGTNNTINNFNFGSPAVQDNILEILRSLSLPNFRDIHLDTLAKATEGTCTWLTTGGMFLLWIVRGKILWGIGIPGAGKTILA